MQMHFSSIARCVSRAARSYAVQRVQIRLLNGMPPWLRRHDEECGANSCQHFNKCGSQGLRECILQCVRSSTILSAARDSFVC